MNGPGGLGSRAILAACAVALACVLTVPACGRSTSSAAPDASRPKIVPARPPPAAGELPLDLAHSKVVVTIIKDRDLKAPVTGALALRDGAASLSGGSARLSIDLDTFDSGIPLRNERVRNIFFETSGVGWDTAELSIAKLPDAVLASMRDAKRVSGASLDGTLRLHGKTVPLTMIVDAGYTDAGALWVKTSVPAVVRISDVGLTPNLKRLSALCMHDSIDDDVKAEVDLVFAAH
jgi:polyisoprenoid-binding protein YceI